MGIENHFLSKQDLIRLVLNVYDDLAQADRNAYKIGQMIGQQKGKEFTHLVQGARTLVSSYVSDLLVEILHPLVLEENELYPILRKRCLEEFIAGLVKSTL